MANPDWLKQLFNDVANFKMPEPTFSSLLLAQFDCGLTDLPEHLKERKFKRVTSNYTAYGVEAVYKDETNGQLYKVDIRPMKEGE